MIPTSIIILLCLISFALIILFVYFAIRTIRVEDFLSNINNHCINYAAKAYSVNADINNDANNPAKWCKSKLPNYNKMVFSFKKITYENWLPYDVIDRFESLGIELKDDD